ncbi:AlbA family DNA-binding domain-containing protein [Evansella halocellulosilytica]|uniref:AlbA family DNA-binding domain-containing protein n=1 Tax=Evansella halocellulosilytica TaxID=2011013 RepID=UPI000BB7B8BD|nr:ATP-binding protein [Evansella halocellulosilytica]
MIKEKINNLLEEGYECDFLDYKLKQYPPKLNPNFIKDVMAMANSHYDGDKFIIIGVNDNGEIIGIDKNEVFVDSAIYQDIILNYVEPDITIDYFKHSYEGKILGVLKIAGGNNNKPYLIRKEIDSLKLGSCIIRKGSKNSSANRSDFDNFYYNKENFYISILTPILRAVNDNDGLAYLQVSIRNHTSLPVTIISGALYVLDNHNTIISKHSVYGLDNYVGADFKLALSPMSEKVGDLHLGFTSTDCLRLGLDQHGTTEKEFLFKIKFFDTLNNEYTVDEKDCVVIAKGEFLWKVK